MKIFYLTDQFYKHGGAEKTLSIKANQLSSNHEIYIITTEQKNNPPIYALEPNIKIIDLNVNYIRNKSYLNILNLVKLPNHFHKLYKFLNHHKPDIVVSLSTQPDYYFLPLIKTKSVNIKEFHSSFYYKNIERNKSTSIFNKLIYRFKDFIEKSYDSLVVLTPEEKEYFKNINISIIPNPIPSLPEHEASLNKEAAIYVGRIAPVKQLDKLITIWSKVVKKFPTWKLFIYGEGDLEYEKKLQGQVKNNNLHEHIHFCGPTNDPNNKILDSSFCLLSSLTECFPMIILESMALGVPVITFDCPNGPRNIVENEINGLLVQDQNINDFVTKIELLINDGEKRKELGVMARKKMNAFLPNQIANEWEILFNSLINKTNK